MQIPEAQRPAILDAVRARPPRKIEAIKLVRQATGCGLKEAKEFVEKLESNPDAIAQDLPVMPRAQGCFSLCLGTMLLGSAGCLAVRMVF